MIAQGANPGYYINNHVDITITYHSGEKEEWGSTFGDEGGRIVGEFLVISRRAPRRGMFS